MRQINVELFFVKIMYLYILISKKNIAVSSTIFVGRGRFALPKLPKQHFTYRKADLSTPYCYVSPLVSSKALWKWDSNPRPQGNEPCELPTATIPRYIINYKRLVIIFAVASNFTIPFIWKSDSNRYTLIRVANPPISLVYCCTSLYCFVLTLQRYRKYF